MPIENSEEEDILRKLILLSQDGDKVAYEELLTRIVSILRPYCSRFLAGFGIAEDCLQEILISVDRALHTYNKSYPVKPWLFTLAKRRVIDFLRKETRRAKFEFAHPDLAEQAIDPSALEDKEELALFYSMLENLKPSYREALTLTKIEGLSQYEAAEKLGISISALSVRVHRAISALRAEVKKRNYC